VRLHNKSRHPLTGIVGILEEPFRIISGGGDFTLERGERLKVIVEFAPSDEATAEQTLAITSSDPRHPLINIPVTGRGQ
jgi:hypothetical protein